MSNWARYELTCSRYKNADQSATLQREREVLNRVRQERAGTQAKFDNIAAFVANFDAQAGDANQRIESLTASNASIESQLLEKNAQAEALRERLSNADGSFRDVAEQLSQASAAFNQNNIGFIQQQNRVNTLRQELSFREKEGRNSGRHLPPLRIPRPAHRRNRTD
jgi:chromosome segregation protein